MVREFVRWTLLPGALLTAPLGACLQPVVHPTRIEPLGSLSFGASLQTVLDSTIEDGRKISTVTALSFGLSAGFRDTLRDGIASRVSLGAGTGGAYGGIYLEMPRSWLSEWDVGSGAMVYLGEMKAVHPYIQLGYQAPETIAPFVSVGSYLVTNTPGDRVRPAITFGASIDRFDGSQHAATGIFWLSVLTGATRVESTNCVVICFPDRGFFPGTMFLIGLSSNVNVSLPGSGGPRYPSPFPPRR